MPEVVYGPGKTVEQLVSIIGRLLDINGRVLVTRVAAGLAEEVRGKYPEAKYDAVSRLFAVCSATETKRARLKQGAVVLSAGTSDLPVAEETAQTLEFFGWEAVRVYDVGVAGLSRLFAYLDTIREARVIIVVAGMDGALPSVVSGLVDAPVICVPTSIGYGASFEGVAPLLSMLNNCSGGIGVVNIDGGFGAAVLACRILKSGTRED